MFEYRKDDISERLREYAKEREKELNNLRYAAIAMRPRNKEEMLEYLLKEVS